MNVPARGEKDLGRVIDAIALIAQGGSNAIGFPVVSLTPGQTETVVDDPLCSPLTVVMLSPTSQAAAAAQVYVKAAEARRFILGHLAAPEGATLRYERRQP